MEVLNEGGIKVTFEYSYAYWEKKNS